MTLVNQLLEIGGFIRSPKAISLLRAEETTQSRKMSPRRFSSESTYTVLQTQHLL
jgi:hypothetical protein